MNGEGPGNLRILRVTTLAVLIAMAALSIFGVHGPDFFISHLLNRLAGHSLVFDYVVRTLERDMFSNLLLMTLAWYVWFDTDNVRKRTGILIGVVSAFLSGIVSRGLQLALPTHLRPLHEPALHFHAVYGIDPNSLNHWSSFPSDHAAVLFGEALTIYLANRRIGRWAFAFAALTNLTRLYLGFHYCSDIVGGAMLGMLIVASCVGLSSHSWARRLVDVPAKRRALFYAALFYISFGIVTLFTDYRDTASGFLHTLHHHGAPADGTTQTPEGGSTSE